MKLKIYILITFVFLLGMLSGGLIVTQIVQFRMKDLTTNSTQDVYNRVLERMEKKLDLTETQMDGISVIFEEAAKEIEPLRTEMRTKLLDLMRNNSPKIQDELDPQQREKFQEMVSSIMEKLNLAQELN